MTAFCAPPTLERFSGTSPLHSSYRQDVHDLTRLRLPVWFDYINGHRLQDFDALELGPEGLLGP